MSVKVHEPVCEDSAQDLYFWFDHFLGDQLKDEWRSAGDAGGGTTVVDAQTGGIVRITTGALNQDEWILDWGDIRSLLVLNKVTFEARIKIPVITNADFSIGMYNVTAISIQFIESGGDWLIRCQDAGVTQPNSGVSLDTDYHIYRIECFPTDEVHFYIDGVECANSPITVAADIPNEYLQPYFQVNTDEAVAKTMDIDYVVVRQER